MPASTTIRSLLRRASCGGRFQPGFEVRGGLATEMVALCVRLGTVNENGAGMAPSAMGVKVPRFFLELDGHPKLCGLAG